LTLTAPLGNIAAGRFRPLKKIWNKRESWYSPIQGCSICIPDKAVPKSPSWGVAYLCNQLLFTPATLVHTCSYIRSYQCSHLHTGMCGAFRWWVLFWQNQLSRCHQSSAASWTKAQPRAWQLCMSAWALQDASLTRSCTAWHKDFLRCPTPSCGNCIRLTCQVRSTKPAAD